MLKKCESLALADLILKAVRKLFPKNWDGYVKTWSNCREQGYVINVYSKSKIFQRAAACFAMGRSCDQPVAVVGTCEQFVGDQPSDEAWEAEGQRKYFGAPEYLIANGSYKKIRDKQVADCAAWIVAKLKVFMERAEA